MKNLFKRIIAVLVLVGTLTSFVIPATFADSAEAGTIVYDLEVYNYDRYKPMIGTKGSYALSRTAENALDGVYTKGQSSMSILANDYPGILNWKIEGFDSSMSTGNLTLYADANTGLRIQKPITTQATSGWIAFRLNIPKRNTYDLDLVIEGSLHTHNADTYLFLADQENMSEAALESLMTEENKVGATASELDSATTITYENVEIAAEGEYILAIKMAEITGKTTLWLSQIVLTPVSSSAETTVATTQEDTTQATTQVTTEATTEAPEETTEATTAPGGDSDRLFPDGVYDFEIYHYDRYLPMVGTKSTFSLSNGSEGVLSGAYATGKPSYEILAQDYPKVLNWKVEGMDSSMSYRNLTLYVTANTGVRIQKTAGDQPESGWIALRIAVPQAGMYDLNVITKQTWCAHTVYLFGADKDTMSEEILEGKMIPENLLAEHSGTTGHTPDSPYTETYRNIELAAAGEYIVLFKMEKTADKATLYLSGLTLTAATGEEPVPPQEPEEPEGDLIPGGAITENFFDLELYRYQAFANMAGTDIVYTKAYNTTDTVASYLEKSYPSKVNWKMEGYTADKVLYFRGKTLQGLRADVGAGGYLALRLNVQKTGNYHITFSSVHSYAYDASVYLIPAPNSDMSAEQIQAVIADENKIGTISITAENRKAAILDYSIAQTGEYIVILVTEESERIYLSNIALAEVGMEEPKEPVDKMLYNFDLVSIQPDIRQTGFSNWYDENSTIRVSQKIAQWYDEDILQWKYEGRSDTAISEVIREKYLRFKSTEDMIQVEKGWNAFRLESPGAGTYDVRMKALEKNIAVVNIYLIPAVTGVPMTQEQIEKGMTNENLLIKKARLSGEDNFYLGEYTFGTNHEYVMVIEFVRGTRLNLVNMEMTKDGLVADGTLPVAKRYDGTVYDLDLADPFEGVFYGESKFYMADVFDKMQSRWNSGAQNWIWLRSTDDLQDYDSDGNPIPGSRLRFYQSGGMYVYSEQDSWVALKIKSPGEGDFTISLNHAVCPDSGTVAMYVLPADTDLDKLWEATDPANRIGMATLTNNTGLAGKTDGYTTYVGYDTFEAGKEYILLLECYAASRYNDARANMNISQIVMERGIKEYEAPEEVKVVNPIAVAKSVVSVADMGDGNFACFQMNGMDYYLVQLEGGALYLYNLDTGEIEDEQFIRGSRPRHMAVADDGKVWMTNSWKYLVCYDPVTKTYEKTKSYLPTEFKHNGFAYMVFDENGAIYAATNNIGHVVKYDPDAKTYTDLGVIRGVVDYISSMAYKDGYLYVHCMCKGEYNSVVKYNVATGQTEGICEFYDLAGENLAYGMGFLGEDILSVGVVTIDNDRAITIDINTMELVDLGLPGYVNQCPTEEIDGKHYVICGSYGLYEYDVATGATSKVPGFTSMSASGFRSSGHTNKGQSVITLGDDLCLISNNSKTYCSPRIINLTTKEYYEWRDLTRTATGGGSEIISLTTTAEGANEVVMGFWNAHFAATYHTETGTIVNMTETAGQSDAIGFYKDILYAGCYSATVLVELDRDNNDYIQRFKLDHEQTQQKRLFSMEFGDDKVFVGSIPDTNCNGGSLTVYDTLTGQWYSERNLIPDQSIVDEAYWNKVVFITSSRTGGSNTQPAGDSALILAYDYENREVLATLDPRDYISGLPSPVEYLYGLTTDPNADENGRIWAVVADTLFCFTFDKETNTFEVQTVLSFERTKYNTSGGVSRQQSKVQFIPERNQLYVVFKDSGTYCLTLEDWDAPIGEVKIKEKERIMSYRPEEYLVAHDGNMYFGNLGDLMMLPLNVTAEDWAIAKQVDDQIMAIGEVTLESEAAIKNARSAYENLSYYYKALVQKLYVLEEAEVDLLECKIAQWDGKEIVADDVTALQELMDTYKPLNNRQKRYVKNYLLLRSSYEQADSLNDQRVAAAMQVKVDALKDMFPITLDEEPQVVAVRTELDSLTGSQRYLVDQTILEAAEAQIAELRKVFVKEVEALIQAIPDEITLADEPAIIAAREAVDKLYVDERKQVSYSKLENAEVKLRSLKSAKEKAVEVDAMIEQIGFVTWADADLIYNARAAYNGLDDVAKSMVTLEPTLYKAENVLYALQTWAIPAAIGALLALAFGTLCIIPTTRKKIFKGKKKASSNENAA